MRQTANPKVRLSKFEWYGSGFRRSRRFEQEPRAALGFVDPGFKEARGGDVAMFIAQRVGSPHLRCELLVVVAKLSEHVAGRHKVGIVVEKPLAGRDLPY